MIKNIYFLQKHSLEKDFQKIKNLPNMDELIDTLQYERYGVDVPRIMDIEATIQKICTEEISLARFGDGEFELIEGNDIAFQKYSPHLSKRLKEVLSSNDPRIGIAIPYALYSNKKERTEYNRQWWRQVGPHFRNLLSNYLDMKSSYYPSELTLFSVYSTEKEKFENYFKNIRKIWHQKDIHLICGKGTLDKLSYNIFDNAKTVTYQDAPSKDAFEQYETILENTLKVDSKKLVIIMLGPTATVLAYDLALKGYQALDLGHIAKSYDYWKKEKDLSNESESTSFFKPD